MGFHEKHTLLMRAKSMGPLVGECEWSFPSKPGLGAPGLPQSVPGEGDAFSANWAASLRADGARQNLTGREAGDPGEHRPGVRWPGQGGHRGTARAFTECRWISCGNNSSDWGPVLGKGLLESEAGLRLGDCVPHVVPGKPAQPNEMKQSPEIAVMGKMTRKGAQ